MRFFTMKDISARVLFSLDSVTSFWQECLYVIVCYCGLLQRDMLSQQAWLHMACGALTYNSPSCLSAVVWPTFIRTNTVVCFVLHFHKNAINKWQRSGSWSFLVIVIVLIE